MADAPEKNPGQDAKVGHPEGDSTISDHGHESPPAGVIPEKSWQDGLLTIAAWLTLAGLGWMMCVWSTFALPPVEIEQGQHQ